MTKEVIDDFCEEIGELEEKVDERLSYRLSEFLTNISLELEECESPIEKILFIELDKQLRKNAFYYNLDIVGIIPQANLKISDKKKYRVDFLVEIKDFRLGIDLDVAIECDGHEFHQKTKEQAESDRKRERDILESGRIVIRFTGSEIFNESPRCARQLIRIIRKHIDNQVNKG